MAEPTMYKRIVAAREEMKSRNFGALAAAVDLSLEVLERQYAPSAEPDPEVEKDYESMEEAAFGVAKAAKRYVFYSDSLTLTRENKLRAVEIARGKLWDEVAKYKECESQYESNFE